jgi:hypothetical protein
MITLNIKLTSTFVTPTGPNSTIDEQHSAIYQNHSTICPIVIIYQSHSTIYQNGAIIYQSHS